jgi:hypothetical protein
MTEYVPVNKSPIAQRIRKVSHRCAMWYGRSLSMWHRWHRLLRLDGALFDGS